MKYTYTNSSRLGSNQHVTRLSYFDYTRAFAFMAFWTLILLYCFRIGLQYVVIPGIVNWSETTFRMTAYSTTAVVPVPKPVIKTVLHAKKQQPKTITKEDIIYSQKHGDIIYRIYGLESSFGQEPFLYCTRQGEVSDMGFNVLNHQCFASFTQEVQTVEQWLEDHEGMSLGQELCLYNTGKTDGCVYKENFLSL